jgi:hypothetical protein
MDVFWIVLVVIAVIVHFALRGRASTTASMICPHCGTQAEPSTRTKGSFVLELFLWLLLIVPGLIYSIWRVTSRDKVCPACGEPGMIPVTSPRGRALVEANRLAAGPARA